MRLLKKEKTYKDLIYYILSENLNINDRIPTERELCEKFNVSRITLRDAVCKLVDEGILMRNGRNGTRVKNIPSKEDGKGVTQKQILFVYFSSQPGGFMEQAGTAPGQLYRGIEKYVNENTDVIMVQTGENFLKINTSVLNSIDGVIIGGDAVKKAFSKVSARKIPAIMIDYPVPLLNIDSIFEDQYEAGYLACRKVHKRNKAKNILFLGMLYDKENRLQSGYREQLRGAEEFIYKTPETKLFKHNVSITKLGNEQDIAGSAAKLNDFIITNNIEGIIVCSNLLEDLILFYEEQYKSIGTGAVSACVITAEALRKTETPVDAIFLNLEKIGYLATKYLYKNIESPYGQRLRIAIPVSE